MRVYLCLSVLAIPFYAEAIANEEYKMCIIHLVRSTVSRFAKACTQTILYYLDQWISFEILLKWRAELEWIFDVKVKPNRGCSYRYQPKCIRIFNSIHSNFHFIVKCKVLCTSHFPLLFSFNQSINKNVTKFSIKSFHSFLGLIVCICAHHSSSQLELRIEWNWSARKYIYIYIL